VPLGQATAFTAPNALSQATALQAAAAGNFLWFRLCIFVDETSGYHIKPF